MKKIAAMPFPRACGGDPTDADIKAVDEDFSPRMRR